MPGDADADRFSVLRTQRPVEDALVVGVRILLGRVGSQGPPVDRRIDAFHRQVGTLDHAHFDRSATGRTTLSRPCGELLQRTERVRQVCLKDHARLETLQTGLLEQPGEHRDGQVEVLVLLHVEVDELGGGRRGGEAVQRGQALDDVLDGFVERPHRQLADHG